MHLLLVEVLLYLHSVITDYRSINYILLIIKHISY